MFPIVSVDLMWDSELANDVPLDEVCALCLDDRRDWFCVHPFGEIIDRYDRELGLHPSNGKWVD